MHQPSTNDVQPHSDEEMIPDPEMKKRGPLTEVPILDEDGDNELDIERLLEDVEYLPPAVDPAFRAQRRERRKRLEANAERPGPLYGEGCSKGSGGCMESVE